MDLNIPPSAIEQIEKVIASADSPVGIDAKKTHVIIIQKLLAIEKRLGELERRINEQ